MVAKEQRGLIFAVAGVCRVAPAARLFRHTALVPVLNIPIAPILLDHHLEIRSDRVANASNRLVGELREGRFNRSANVVQ